MQVKAFAIKRIRFTYVSLLLLGTLCLYGFLSYSTGCTSQASPTAVSEKIQELDSPDGFEGANALQYQQDYEQAAKLYENRLASEELNPKASIYAINQLTYCQLIINQKQKASAQLEKASLLLQHTNDIPLSFYGDHYYNQARYFFLQAAQDSAIHYAHLALQNYDQALPVGHLKIAQTLTLLAFIHLKDGHLTDSIQVYALHSNNYFLSHPILKPFDWEKDYVQGFTCLYNRAHEVGEFHCRAALEKLGKLPFNNPWLEARILSLLGRMIRKRGDNVIDEDPERRRARMLKHYWEADSIFQASIEVADQYADVALPSFYNEWLRNIIHMKDTSYLRQALDDFKERFPNPKIWEPYFDRLMGYHYFDINREKTITHYLNFLAAVTDSSEYSYKLLAESYYSLRIAYRELGNYEESARFAKESLVLYNCIGEEVDINQLEAISALDSTRRYCFITSGFFAQGLLKKYYATQKLSDLELALAYFDFAGQHSFRSLFKTDEDAFLTFQIEEGGKIYAKAIEAAYEAWQLTKHSKWLNKAWNYIELLKSYLLFRDMLRKSSDERQQLLVDSIRIVQGQVNQMLAELAIEQPLSRPAHYDNTLLNLLYRLEHRRLEKFDAIELHTYRQEVSVSDIQSALQAKQGVVSYYHSNQYLFGIYIDQDTIQFFRQSQADGAIRQAITAFRASLEQEKKLSPEKIESYLRSGHFLYQKLIRPFEKQLTQLDKLVIIPDQLLDPICFEALLSEPVDALSPSFRELPYLLHQVQIVYTSSWKVFQVNQERVRSDYRDNSIGFWTTPALSRINRLDVIEEAVKANFGETYQAFKEGNGGKQVFQNRHHEFDILHLLLHANSSRIIRYDNKIRFGEDEEELIYGFELSEESFDSKLLVLASCESATGTPRAGEGTFSLVRSFMSSGIPEVVAARFLIPQTTTGPLLASFYQHLAVGKDATQALHLAKIEYLRTIDKDRYAYPRFWAGIAVFN